MQGEGEKGGEGGVEGDKCSCLPGARRGRVGAARTQPTQLHTARGAALNSHGTAGHTTPDTAGKHRRGKKTARRHSAATGRVRGDERERLTARGGSYLAEAGWGDNASARRGDWVSAARRLRAVHGAAVNIRSGSTATQCARRHTGEAGGQRPLPGWDGARTGRHDEKTRRPTAREGHDLRGGGT